MGRVLTGLLKKHKGERLCDPENHSFMDILESRCLPGGFRAHVACRQSRGRLLENKPPPDVDKGWLYKNNPVTGKKIWNNGLVCFGGQYAGRGRIGNGLTAQNRALDIYGNMVNHYVTTLQDWDNSGYTWTAQMVAAVKSQHLGQLTRTIRFLACSNSRDPISRNP